MTKQRKRLQNGENYDFLQNIAGSLMSMSLQSPESLVKKPKRSNVENELEKRVRVRQWLNFVGLGVIIAGYCLDDSEQ